MKNAQIMVEGNTLTIKVDLSKEFGRRRAWGGITCVSLGTRLCLGIGK